MVFALYIILSLSLGPALKIGITEPLILGIVAVLIWGSFFIGVKNSTELKSEVQINEEEWDREEQDEYIDSKQKIAIPEEEAFKKVKAPPKKSMEATNVETEPNKDVRDRLADLKSEFNKTKKRSASLGVGNIKR